MADSDPEDTSGFPEHPSGALLGSSCFTAVFAFCSFWKKCWKILHSLKKCVTLFGSRTVPHRIHGWYIYLHLTVRPQKWWFPMGISKLPGAPIFRGYVRFREGKMAGTQRKLRLEDECPFQTCDFQNRSGTDRWYLWGTLPCNKMPKGPPSSDIISKMPLNSQQWYG